MIFPWQELFFYLLLKINPLIFKEILSKY